MLVRSPMRPMPLSSTCMEATSEKMAMGHFCDGRASLVSSARTATCRRRTRRYFPVAPVTKTDAGACADYDNVIGMEKFEPVQRFVKKMSTQRFAPSNT